MEQFGRVKEVWLPRDADKPSNNRGFGKVTFESPDSVISALQRESLNLMGRTMRIIKARPRYANDRDKLFGRLKHATGPAEVEDVLAKIGDLRSVKEASMAIRAWGAVREWSRALKLLSEMRDRGLEPNLYSYNSAIAACEQPERALELLSEMRSCGLKPDVIAYNSAISVCEKGLQPQRALELLSEMRDRGVEPDVITYNAAISACE